jgi:uncharacterized protein (DUF2336 family)
VAQVLARDVEAVALPILQHSTVLEEEDLLGAIDGASSERLTAIARQGSSYAQVAPRFRGLRLHLHLILVFLRPSLVFRSLGSFRS